MSAKRYTVTSALLYANGPIHLGHISGAYLPADIYVRYLKGKGYDVVFGVIMGTGVGGGIVINGTLHKGRTNIAGEWGHRQGVIESLLDDYWAAMYRGKAKDNNREQQTTKCHYKMS